MENQNIERFYIRDTASGQYCSLNTTNYLIVVSDISEAQTFTAEEVELHLTGRKKRFYEVVPVHTPANSECRGAELSAETEDETPVV